MAPLLPRSNAQQRPLPTMLSKHEEHDAVKDVEHGAVKDVEHGAVKDVEHGAVKDEHDAGAARGTTASLWRSSWHAQVLLGVLVYSFQACTLSCFVFAALPGDGGVQAWVINAVQALSVAGFVCGALLHALGIAFWPPTLAACLRADAAAAAAAGTQRHYWAQQLAVKPVWERVIGEQTIAGTLTDHPRLRGAVKLVIQPFIYVLIPMAILIVGLVSEPGTGSTAGKAMLALTVVCGAVPLAVLALTFALAARRHRKWFDPEWDWHPAAKGWGPWLYNLLLRWPRLGRLGEGTLPDCWAQLAYRRLNLDPPRTASTAAGTQSLPDGAWDAHVLHVQNTIHRFALNAWLMIELYHLVEWLRLMCFVATMLAVTQLCPSRDPQNACRKKGLDQLKWAVGLLAAFVALLGDTRRSWGLLERGMMQWGLAGACLLRFEEWLKHSIAFAPPAGEDLSYYSLHPRFRAAFKQSNVKAVPKSVRALVIRDLRMIEERMLDDVLSKHEAASFL